MKLAKLFWSIGSILLNVVIGIYVYLMSNKPSTREEVVQYVNDNWSIYGAHWKAEFLIMALITIGALYFALYSRKVSWTIVAAGQIILLFTYPIMLGGYHNTPLELFEMANEVATIVFVFGNLVLFGGLFLVYFQDEYLKKWIKIAAFSISGVMALVFAILFMGFTTWNEVLVIAPLANVMYLINAYYGSKLKLENTGLAQTQTVLE
ncbi:MAG: hypothetical protein AAF634_09945 [Bacteroidota bacterium]